MTKICPVMPVVIAWKSYPWIRVGVQSFRRHFPLAPLLIIDNNPDEDTGQVLAERKWLAEWTQRDHGTLLEKTHKDNREHGSGMDFAADWCRNRGIQWMLHFEPDCLISGVGWARNLVEATHGDIWMAGSHRRSYGVIHPTPSIWDVNRLRFSFEVVARGEDEKHPLFSSLMDMVTLESILADDERPFWAVYWDAAQKPWFEAAKEGRAVLVDDGGDFYHFCGGSRWNPDPHKCTDLRVREYL